MQPNPKTILLLNAKGGVGKTTVAVHLACHLQKRGERVAVIDCDPLGAATHWLARAAPAMVVWQAGSTRTFQRCWDRAAGYAGVIVIDGVARVDQAMVVAAGCANLICVPVGPSPLELAGLVEMGGLLSAIQTERGASLVIRVLLNNIRRCTCVSESLLSHPEVCGFLRLNRVLPQREAFRQAYAQGCVVQDLGYRARDASAAMDAVCMTMWEILTGWDAVQRRPREQRKAK